MRTNEIDGRTTVRRVASLLFFLFFCWFWATRYADFLRVAQNFALFPPNGAEFWETTRAPGGPLEAATLLLEQFFFFPALGGALLAAILSTAQILAARLGDSSARAYFASFLPPVFAALLFVDVDLNVFESTAGTFYLEPILGVFAVFLLATCFRAIRNETGRRVFGLGVAAFAFPLLGVFSFLSVAAILTTEFATVAATTSERSPENASPPRSRRNFWRFAIVLTSVVAAAPLVWGAVRYPSFDAATLYRTGIVSDSKVDLGAETNFRQNVLYFATTFATIACGFLRRRRTFSSRTDAASPTERLKNSTFARANAGAEQTRSTNRAQTASKRPNRSTPKTRGDGAKRRAPEILWVVLLAASLIAAAPRDENFFALLAVADPFDAQDWNRVLAIEGTTNAPVSPLISARNLALFQRGELAERAFDRPLVGAKSRLVDDVSSHRIFGDRLLYSWGFVNLARREATNNYVWSRGRSVWATKTLLLAALAQEEYALADRFARRLERSLFHRAWVAKYRDYLDFKRAKRGETFPDAAADDDADANSEFGAKIASAAEFSPEIAAVNAEFAAIRRLAPRENYLETLTTPDLSVQLGIVRRGKRRNEQKKQRESGDAIGAKAANDAIDAAEKNAERDLADDVPELEEARLVFALTTFDLPSFLEGIDAFRQANKDARTPKTFQEAVLLANALGRFERVDEFRFDPEILSRFRQFTRLAETLRQDPNDPDVRYYLRVGFENSVLYYLLYTKNNDWY